MFCKTFSRDASPEAAASLKAIIAVELRDDGDDKFSGSDMERSVWIWDMSE